jgi:uncharacterized protein YecE (DUF72 family)
MQIYAGTSGYSYKEWKGPFYPEKIKNDEMLAFYATKLPTVEVNNTFYRMPRTSMLETWGEQVPADFRFVLKASRRISHIKRLKNVSDEVDYLFNAVEVLGDRLGVVFFQLPPNFKKDAGRLADFLELLPGGVSTAFEFRHESWFDDETFDTLRRHDCALCLADTDDDLDVPLVSTAKWGYLRLRRPGYDDKELSKWLSWIRDQEWEDAYVFFKHEDAGAGPEMAGRFLSLAEKG